jgi:hypothetical protein
VYFEVFCTANGVDGAGYSKDRSVLLWGENGVAAAQFCGHCATPQQTLGDQCFITLEISTNLNRFP